MDDEVKDKVEEVPKEEAKPKKNCLNSFVVKLAIFLVLAIMVGALGAKSVRFLRLFARFGNQLPQKSAQS